MELKEIKELIKLVSEAGVSEVEVERGDFKIAIKKVEEKVYVQSNAPVMQPQVVMQAPVAATHSAPVTPVSELATNLITIKSPMIGTFYKSSSPDKPAFVGVGDEIVSGKVLCIIEAMKLFNEIEAEVSGRIVKVLVENASPVEYDQPLFLVEPM
ncbi:MAG: acetyl-CoA carboxylase biotin carboxyl carrier protein [Bacteroidia bacterium]|nr:acetyl-CoA carboxylase biotin carboxyl carrier protein [Bacteroidia bacterium]MBP9688339.1 acetyl-CoA carboxylase biotin carboxyl carrier protein [Bacteroidia bacterium]